MWKFPDKGELPDFGLYVLVKLRLASRLWHSNSDPEGVYYRVARRVPDKVAGNNEREFSWMEFGPCNYFGQEVLCWMVIPRQHEEV